MKIIRTYEEYNDLTKLYGIGVTLISSGCIVALTTFIAKLVNKYNHRISNQLNDPKITRSFYGHKIQRISNGPILISKKQTDQEQIVPNPLLFTIDTNKKTLEYYESSPLYVKRAKFFSNKKIKIKLSNTDYDRIISAIELIEKEDEILSFYQDIVDELGLIPSIKYTDFANRQFTVYFKSISGFESMTGRDIGHVYDLFEQAIEMTEDFMNVKLFDENVDSNRVVRVDVPSTTDEDGVHHDGVSELKWKTHKFSNIADPAPLPDDYHVFPGIRNIHILLIDFGITFKG